MEEDLVFATRLRALRIEKDKKLRQAAAEMGISKSALSEYETAKKSPKLKAIKKIAAYYDESIDYIIGTSPYRSIKKIAN